MPFPINDSMVEKLAAIAAAAEVAADSRKVFLLSTSADEVQMSSGGTTVTLTKDDPSFEDMRRKVAQKACDAANAKLEHLRKLVSELGDVTNAVFYPGQD